ncbi:MAG: hypothetical protein ACJAVM_002277 [Sulfitobacter sp.]|jgi:hypothetical protein
MRDFGRSLIETAGCRDNLYRLVDSFSQFIYGLQGGPSAHNIIQRFHDTPAALQAWSYDML